MNIEKLQKKLGYRFKDSDLIAEACRHSSYVNEHPNSGLGDNERLEFLGDAVLNLAIGHLLLEQYPNLPEGDLSRMRASLVNEHQLADFARELNIGAVLLLGKGEEMTDGRNKNSILADAFEAIMAAIYLDGGFDPVFLCIRRLFSKKLKNADTTEVYSDFKSRLQELTQSNFKTTPVYKVIRETGPDHDKTFVVLMTSGPIQTKGTGKNKKLAEQDAARKAIEMLNAKLS